MQEENVTFRNFWLLFFDFSKIKYVKVSGSKINTELVSNLASGTTLYVAEVVRNGDGTGHITNVRSKNNYHGSIAQFKYDNSTKTLSFILSPLEFFSQSPGIFSFNTLNANSFLPLS